MPLCTFAAALMGSMLPKLASAISIALISVYSLLPQAERINTGMSGGLEHLFAYGLTGFLLTLARGAAHSPVTAVISLAGVASLLEWLQHWAPGRHPNISDAVISTAASALGAALAAWLRDVVLRTINRRGLLGVATGETNDKGA